MGTSCICSPGRGPTAPPGSSCHRWSCLEKLAAIVPLPRVHLVRYGGCLAPHSTLRAAIIPTPRQQGVDGEEAKTGTPYWNWARLLGRVFAPGYGDLSSATVWAEGSAQTRCADAVAPGLATFRCAAVAHCGSLPPSPRSR